MTRAKRQAGFTLIELIVVVSIIALLGYSSVANFRNMQDHSNNVAVDANVKQIAMALERYRSDKDHLPKTDLIGTDNTALVPATSFLLSPTNLNFYLQGNQLPKGPFAPSTQGNSITYPLTDDAAFTRAVSVNTVTIRKTNVEIAGGNGKYPGMVAGKLTTGVVGGWDKYTYGAVLYSVNGNADTYVLAGIGKRGNKAVIATEISNGN